MTFYKVAAAIISAADRDAANAKLSQQGYGPCFTAALEDLQGTVTHYGCYMPLDAATASAVDQVVKEFGGEWVMDELASTLTHGGDAPGYFKRLLIRKLLRLRLRLKRES